MSYEEFDFGELISSTKLNANYAALSQDLTTTATTLQGKITNLNNTVSSLGSRIDNPDTAFKTTLLNLLYPVGSIYVTASTAGTCPIQTSLGGTWSRVSANRVLQGGNAVTDAGGTKAAGLPNITATLISGAMCRNTDPTTSGAFSAGTGNNLNFEGGDVHHARTLYFNASNSNSIMVLQIQFSHPHT